MKNLKFYASLVVITAIFFSCNEDDDSIITIDDTEEMIALEAYENGFLVSHEGAFSGGFGTVSFLDDALSTSENGIYQSVNNDNLGGVVQSMAFSETNAFVISNLSNRVTVVDRFTFEEIARVDQGLSNPRYMAIANGKGYVTNWGDGSVATDDYILVIDLTTNTSLATIPVGEGPEQILYDGTSIYVSHKGGFSVNNIVTVINPDTDEVETTIEVGDAPDEMEIDSEGDLWVLSEGTLAFQGTETGGRFTKINTTTNEPIVTTILADTMHPSYMDLEGGDVYYYLNGSVFRAGINDDLSGDDSPILEGLSFYGMSVINGQLLGCNAGDFNSNGTIEVYDLTSNTLTTTLEVGLIPAKVYANF